MSGASAKTRTRNDRMHHAEVKTWGAIAKGDGEGRARFEADVAARSSTRESPQSPAQYHTTFGVEALRGRGLRFVLVEHIRKHQTLTVTEMVEALAADGFTIDGRASKVVSDALRWEVARGRIKRVGRGVYAYGRVPASTARRIRPFAHLCQQWLVALRRTQQLPPIPPTPKHRLGPFQTADDPYQTPWANLNWLWGT